MALKQKQTNILNSNTQCSPCNINITNLSTSRLYWSISTIIFLHNYYYIQFVIVKYVYKTGNTKIKHQSEVGGGQTSEKKKNVCL